MSQGNAWQQPPGPPGYGAPGYGPGYGMAPAPKKSSAVTCIIIAAVAILFVVPVFAALSIYGVRRYLQSAKASEAKNSVTTIARAAKSAYEREQPDGSHRMCPSASNPVPKTVPSGTKSVTGPGDWEEDRAINAGFACLKFTGLGSSYYQYSYSATPDGFTVTARGDLDADGNLSEFTIRGTVRNNAVDLSQIEIKDEFE